MSAGQTGLDRGGEALAVGAARGLGGGGLHDLAHLAGAGGLAQLCGHVGDGGVDQGGDLGVVELLGQVVGEALEERERLWVEAGMDEPTLPGHEFPLMPEELARAVDRVQVLEHQLDGLPTH